MKKEWIFRLVLVMGIFFLVFQFGIKPMFDKDFLLKKSRQNDGWANSKLSKDTGKYDVIVAGEDPEGIAAAVSASRAGAKALLISRGKDLGGMISKSLWVNLEVNRSSKSNLLNKGIFYEFYKKVGEEFSVEKYNNFVSSLVNAEKNLEVVYNVKLDTPIIEDGKLTGLNASIDGQKRVLYGKRFVDATSEGSLLVKCSVPYFEGSGDINLEKKFLPVSLNFEISGIDWKDVQKLINSKDGDFYKKAKQYESSHINIRIHDLKLTQADSNKLIVKGLEVFDIDVSNKKLLKDSYNEAVNEAKKFTEFLKAEFKEFKAAGFSKAASQFYIREWRHFKGECVLSVNDVLENRDFKDKIALGGGAPVEAGKLTTDFGTQIIGMPEQYGIPLGSIIPLKIDNLLMTGNKASYSSLAMSSAGRLSTSINSGESAGIVAVYSITKNMTPREILKDKQGEESRELQNLMKKQGVFLPEFKSKNSNADNWSYPAVRQLNSLGLIAGGVKNSYQFDAQANEEALALLLVNGIYRLSPDKYSLELNARLKPYFSKDKLTRDKAGELLLALNGVAIEQGKTYSKACESGYINNIIQLRLKDKQILTMDDVYYLGDYNIKLFTGKDIAD